MSIHKKLQYDGRNEAMTGILMPNTSSSPKRMEVTCSDSDVFSGYIDEVLSDLGIQFSPGGSGIVEIHEDYDASQVLAIEEELVEASSKAGPREVLASFGRTNNSRERQYADDTAPGVPSTPYPQHPMSSAPRIPRTPCPQQPVAPATHVLSVLPHKVQVKGQAITPLEEKLVIDEEGETPGASSCDVAARPRKLKVYEICHPLQDSEQERRRQNAINAKINREKRKRLIADLRKQVKSLTHINNQCCKALLKTNADVQRLHGRVQELEENKKILDGELKGKAREIRDRRERQVLLRGNLELIADSLEDDNPAKRLINAVVERLPLEISQGNTH